jgi:hypothetical protein
MNVDIVDDIEVVPSFAEPPDRRQMSMSVAVTRPWEGCSLLR